ncbi:MAG: thiamine pyrophosphate-dependent enzyme, partial [Terrimicrobiaceae bacterium]|nr:thiamine pyrophosphate-dependent enzyme [Terrimicrobiaceae bacterium]
NEEEQAGGGAILELAEALGWPVLADALSGLPARPPVAAHADFLLAAGQWPAPQAVLHLGGALVSKRLGRFASQAREEAALQVSRSPRTWDPWNQQPRKITMDPIVFCRAAVGTAKPGGGWLHQWLEAGRLAGEFLSRRLEGRLCEPSVARMAASELPDGFRLFLGNSLPIRDFDSFAEWPGGARRVHGNRGASGIDGNIATAAGLAEHGPTLALIGDLAALHDLSSLALARARNLPLTLVVVNNRGGGIFRFLDLPGADLDPLWETPHDLSPAALAGAAGWKTFSPKTCGELASALREAMAGRQPALIEVASDKAGNHRLHLELVEEFGAILARADGLLA